MPDVTIQIADPADQRIFILIEELDRYLTGLYPPESNHILSVEELKQPNVLFLTAALEGQIVGCGAVVNQGDFAEIKRMFVLPRVRGLRIGRRILDELEAIARSWGMAVARLETGVWQPEALGLYEKAGYRRRPPFGDYGEHPLCVFMEKKLDTIPGG
jgi:putative acetyltransferase